MSIDFKSRLAKYQGASQNNNSKFEKIDYKTLYWKPVIGEQTVRIVPAIWSKEDPTKMIQIHQWKVFKKIVYTLRNFGEKDPAIDLMKELYEENDPESLKIARALKPTDTFYVPVIVRGEEEKGVRLWKYTSKDTDKKLCTILNNEKKWGKIFDVLAGRDLDITGYEVTKERKGMKSLTYVAVDIDPSLDKTPLSDDPKLIEKWLKEQKDPIDLAKKFTFDEVKDMLQAYLFPEEDQITETPEVIDEEGSAESETEDTPPFIPDAEATDEEDTEEDEAPAVVAKKSVPKTTKTVTATKTPAAKKPVAETTKSVQTQSKTTVKGNTTKTKMSVADKFDSMFND